MNSFASNKPRKTLTLNKTMVRIASTLGTRGNAISVGEQPPTPPMGVVEHLVPTTR